jgi:23S rRNA (cytosine1962-C5)-methyltransferase
VTILAEALVNRVLKNSRHLRKWAQREGLEAYRLYDRDIPELPYAIDCYGDWLHLQLFEGKRPLEEEETASHQQALAEALQIPVQQTVLKYRRRQRGSDQYEKQNERAPFFTVMERGLRFEVNMGRYLDTGLFLDHRDTRQRIRQRAEHARLLNLFAYTGSFTVYAAAGGAEHTVTVDMSQTYQAWTRRNLHLNGFDDPKRHQLVCGDVLKYLEDARRAGERFDLIVLDPPSFSNSKRMQESFDIQRDHVLLLRKTVSLLAPDGELYFSNNRRGFKLDAALEQEVDFEEISRQTVPQDFQRYPPHRCWRVRPLR